MSEDVSTYTSWNIVWQLHALDRQNSREIINKFPVKYLVKLARMINTTIVQENLVTIPYQTSLKGYMNETNISQSDLLKYVVARIFQTLHDLDQHTRRWIIYRFLIKYLFRNTGSKPTYIMNMYSQIPSRFFSQPLQDSNQHVSRWLSRNPDKRFLTSYHI